MKNKMNKLIVTLLTAIMVVTATNTDIHAAITKKTVNVEIGKKATLKVKGKGYKFKSANKKIATVSKKGVVTGKKQGKTTVTAKNKKNTYKFIVKVSKNKKKAIPVSNVPKTVTPIITDTIPTVAPTVTPTEVPVTEPTATPTVMPFNEEYLTEKVNIEQYISDKYAFITVKNESDITIPLVNISFVVKYKNDVISEHFVKEVYALTPDNPQLINCEDVLDKIIDYVKDIKEVHYNDVIFDFTVSVYNEDIKDCTLDYNMSTLTTDDSIYISFVKTTNTEFTEGNISIVFYDEQNNVINIQSKRITPEIWGSGNMKLGINYTKSSSSYKIYYNYYKIK